MDLSIDIAIEHDGWSYLDGVEGLVERAVSAGLTTIGISVKSGTELSVVLCDDAFIRNLNKDWRGKDRATNVLSFPADPSARGVTLGDLVIAYETTRAEAEAEGKSLAAHTTHLVVHGLLHLLGYDHETEAEAEVMEKLEIRALMSLGIASPYEDAAPVGAQP